MGQLENKTQQKIIVSQVVEARSFTSRLKGLLGKTHLPTDQTLWIHHCNSIHTFFMGFPIDVIFVDRQLKVRAVFQNVRPWRLLFPVWGANSVFELAAGVLSANPVRIGDQLHVGA